MQEVFGAKYVSLHVRVSNKGAFHLYTQTLGYQCAARPPRPPARPPAYPPTRLPACDQCQPRIHQLASHAPASRPARIHDREAKYYANGEDAYEMRNFFGAQPAKGAKKAAVAESS
jgi:hypothetical protein